MRPAGLIRVLVVAAMAVWFPALVQAGNGVPAAAPRLSFTADEMRLAEQVAADPGLADFYGTNGLKPIFTGAQGAPRRAALIAAVGQAAAHGLPPGRYRPAVLRRLDREGVDTMAEEARFARAFADWSRDVSGGILEPQRVEPGIKRKVQRPRTGDLLRAFAAAADPAAMLDGLPPQDRRYAALRAALARQSRLDAPPDAPPVPQGVWREGIDDPAVGTLRRRLEAIGFAAPPLDHAQSFDAPLARAVAAYQQAAGLPADGIAGARTVARLNRGAGPEAAAILVALERMRWMRGHDLNARHVWVNLPEFNARIHENGQEVFQTRVVIGKAAADFETPEFSEAMQYMVVNPRWNVPRSITVREYLPRLQANRHAVGHLDVVDGAGNVIPRDRIDFRQYSAKTFPYRMRQKPSDDNALGQVKFMFPNPWNIYLHDTPTKHLFNQSSRAYSHGCIRVGRPVDLAQELLKGQVESPQAVFAKALESGRETYLNLRPPVPVHLVYFTAFPDETGQIRRFPDIYGRDARIHAALVRTALESGAADE